MVVQVNVLVKFLLTVCMYLCAHTVKMYHMCLFFNLHITFTYNHPSVSTGDLFQDHNRYQNLHMIKSLIQSGAGFSYNLCTSSCVF